MNNLVEQNTANHKMQNIYKNISVILINIFQMNSSSW